MGIRGGLMGACLVHRLAEDSSGAPEFHLSTDVWFIGKRIGIPEGSWFLPFINLVKFNN